MAERRTFAPSSSAGGSLSAYEPSYRDTLAALLAQAGRAMGMDNYRATDVGKRVTGLAEWSPLGALTSYDDASRAAASGNYGEAGLAALGAIPMAGKAGRGAVGTLKHEISKTNLPRPLEEMTASYANQRPLKPAVTINPEELEGGTIIPLVGDRTIAGKELTGINETKLDQPVNLQGGPNFMRDNPDVWASDKGAVTKLTKRIDEAGAGGDPVYLMHSSMGGRSGDFSKMMSDTLMEQMKNAPVIRKDRIAFDEAMSAEVPGWPGIDKVTPDWLGSSGGGRTNLAQIMALDKFQKMGFPDVASSRFALTEPDLLNRRSGASGMTIARAQPGAGPVTQPAVQHPTYNTNVPGEYIGGFEKPLPREVVFPDWAATRKPGESRATADRSMLMGDIRQKADNKWLEGVMNYLRSEEGMKYGIGGAIAAGLLTTEQAKELEGGAAL